MASWCVFIRVVFDTHSSLFVRVSVHKKIIAFIGIRVVGSDAHITNIAVIPTYQNKGLGKQLLAEAEMFARQHGCQTMSLEVRISNSGAQRLYTTFGYTTRQVLTEYYSEGNEDALDMVKQLK